MPSHREALRSIRTFPQLIKFLRDEMDWPIESDDFEELTFDYTPEELGIDTAVAAKIEKNGIKRLRPLSANQPWGIFFVKFEPKRLPVVALRRVLSRVVLKKRASANSADRAAWQADDLLFISNYGEGDDRQISIAHFSTHPDNADLPTLMVLGWDSGNTALHLDDVADKLTTNLSWPDAKESPDHWRERWRSAFTLRHREVITTSKILAERLADLAQSIRKRVNAVLKIESSRGPLRRLYIAFKEALIHDLEEDDFADMYAQTIAYGLLTARVSRPGGLVAENLRDMVPVTNPFLKELLESFLAVGGRKGKVDFDELGVSEVVQLLRDADMAAVLRDFGDRNPEEDPAIHFYESFLREYDPEKRMKRGVFYTPRPVVSYIVRSVHELLQTEFGIEEGLASTITWSEIAKKHKDIKIPDGVAPESAFVQILDPATGTATFLVEAIDVIYRTLVGRWDLEGLTAVQQDAAWNEYVPKHLLPRLHGYELMMAPYAIAHMKIGLKLDETGYRFLSYERVRIYLTNALELPGDDAKQREFEEWAPALAHEARAVNAIKRHQRYTVIIGNPPYAGISSNDGQWIEELMERYKVNVRNEERQIQRLSNDYVKFIRFSEFLLLESQTGILGFITDSGYLNGILFRDMRASLRSAFQHPWINNLHGVAMRGATRHAGTDENVFDITQGVAISIFVRNGQSATPSALQYAELIGSRSQKYTVLTELTTATTSWTALNPSAPKYLFVPESHDEDYENWPLLTEIAGTGSPKNDRDSRYGTGIKTRHDEFVIGWTSQDAVNRVKSVANRSESGAALIKELELCTTAHFSIKEARKRACESDLLDHVKLIAYRPFDWRSIVYLREFVCEPKIETMRHMLNPQNIAMAVLRRDRKENGAGFFVARGLIAKDMVSNLDDALVWPLYFIPREGGLLAQQPSDHFGSPNISKKAIVDFTGRLGLTWTECGSGNLTRSIGPQDVFNYAYAVLYSPGYRHQYQGFLKIDFPRIPLIGNLRLFRELTRLGGELVALHLLESRMLDTPVTNYIGQANSQVERISYERGTVWIDSRKKSGFRGVLEPVWNFYIGGYQVCEKWLKDRKGRTLSGDDIAHYQKIVVALTETVRLMAEIDTVIGAQGGWPGAFSLAKN